MGRINTIQVWHSNEGIKPSWYLSRISVLDTKTGQKAYFNCECWLATDRGEGRVEMKFVALNNPIGFKKVLLKNNTYIYIFILLLFYISDFAI